MFRKADSQAHRAPDFDTTLADNSFRFIGSFYVVPEGTAFPTASPTVSMVPSSSAAPWVITSPPTGNPTISAAPTGLVNSLITPEDGNGYESAYGYMFDIEGTGSFPVPILSFNLKFQVDHCDYQAGKNYFGYDDPSQWDLNAQGTINKDLSSTSTKLSVVGQLTPLYPGETRAFYIAFLDCSANWPLALDRGENYTLGAWVEDDHIKLIEGIKKASPLTWSNPFGLGSNYYCKYRLLQTKG